MKIGENIRKIREMKGVTQEYLASQLNISPQAFGKIEREETKLDFGRLEEIAKHLDVDPLDIIKFDENNIFNNTFNNHASVYNQSTYNNDPRLIEVLQQEVEQLRLSSKLLIQFLEKK